MACVAIHRFSLTVRFGNTPRPSGMVHTPMRARSLGEAPVTSWPAIRTSPAVGRTSPAHTLTVVDLPAPFAPSRATTAPGGTVRSTPCSTSMPE
jgi:hypothetical protein